MGVVASATPSPTHPTRPQPRLAQQLRLALVRAPRLLGALQVVASNRGHQGSVRSTAKRARARRRRRPSGHAGAPLLARLGRVLLQEVRLLGRVLQRLGQRGGGGGGQRRDACGRSGTRGSGQRGDRSASRLVAARGCAAIRRGARVHGYAGAGRGGSGGRTRRQRARAGRNGGRRQRRRTRARPSARGGRRRAAAPVEAGGVSQLDSGVAPPARRHWRGAPPRGPAPARAWRTETLV